MKSNYPEQFLISQLVNFEYNLVEINFSHLFDHRLFDIKGLNNQILFRF